MRALPNWDPLQWRGAPVRTLLLLWLAMVLGCAHLDDWAHRAERYRREAAAALMAAQAVLDECDDLQEPKPRLCTEAEKLAETIGGIPGVAP